MKVQELLGKAFLKPEKSPDFTAMVNQFNKVNLKGVISFISFTPHPWPSPSFSMMIVVPLDSH